MKRIRMIALLVAIMMFSMLLVSSSFALTRQAIQLDGGVNPTSTSGVYTVYGTAQGTGNITVKVQITSIGFSKTASGNGFASAEGPVRLIAGNTYTIKVTGTCNGYSETSNFYYTPR